MAKATSRAKAKPASGGSRQAFKGVELVPIARQVKPIQQGSGRKFVVKRAGKEGVLSIKSSRDFVTVFRLGAMDQVEMVKRGLHADTVEYIAKTMLIPKDRLVSQLGLGRATVDRKVKEGRPLSPEQSSRVLGVAKLVGQVQSMVEESGDPKGFDAATWVASWLDRPLPALGGRKPAEFMDTPDGQQLIAKLAAQLQTGSYA